MAATATMTSSGPRYAPEDPTLPKPWRGLVDGKTGYLYFWNPETNVTQYERPTGTSSSAHISSSVQVRQPSPGQQRGYNPDKEDDRYGRGNNGGSRGIQVHIPFMLANVSGALFYYSFLTRGLACFWMMVLLLLESLMITHA